jgi:hypothetical protein
LYPNGSLFCSGPSSLARYRANGREWGNITSNKNWDLSNERHSILNAVQGTNPFELNRIPFSAVRNDSTGIVGLNEMWMKVVLLIRVKGGTLDTYATPGANTDNALEFLHLYARKISDIHNQKN